MNSITSAHGVRPAAATLFLLALLGLLAVFGSCSDDDGTSPARTRSIGLAKRVDSTPIYNGDGSYSFVYVLRVVNTGDYALTNVRAMDDLSMAFAQASSWSVDTLWSTGLHVNTGFDGRDNTNLLSGSDVLSVGASGSIHLELTVKPGGSACEFDNVAYASGVCECGSSLFDQSTDGTNPHTDGDGEPTNDREPTTVDLCVAPVADNTLYENASGSLSNGAGTYLFTGASLQASEAIRRSLVRFDIAGVVPAGATVDSVFLTLYNDRAAPGASPAPVAIHRVLSDWGEGASDADGEEGKGAQAQPGDATWVHTFYDTDQWTKPGGDFATPASGTRQVEGVGFYTWGSTAAMVADVKAWLDTPASNYGWILIGDESSGGTARRFPSREHPTSDRRPRLVVYYTSP
jgi:hypothetical protein